MFHDVAVYFEAGLKENELTPARITDEITNLHAQYVVVQTGYMADHPVVKALAAAVHSICISATEQRELHSETEDVRSLPVFGSVRHEVWSLLREEVLKARRGQLLGDADASGAETPEEELAHV